MPETYSIPPRVRKLREEILEHISRAVSYLFRGDYSVAAVECHRAHQKRLIADELDTVLRG